MAPLKYASTADIKVPAKLIEQVVGQESAVEIIRKAAVQRRHVLLIGSPGTGKSMLGLGLAELLPKETLADILSFPNPNDENSPLIRTVPVGQGRDIVARSRIQAMGMGKNQNVLFFILAIASLIVPFWARNHYKSDVVFAAFFIGGMIFFAAFMFQISIGKRMAPSQLNIPRLIVDNFKKKNAPFFDATGAHAGALLGDVLHDPFQCFLPATEFTHVEDGLIRNAPMQNTIDALFDKHRKGIMAKSGYEAIFLDKNELFVLGGLHGSLCPVEALSCNRQDYRGEAVRLTTSENKELIVTPEHRVAINNRGRIEYIPAKDIKEGTEIITKSEEVILDEQDIINTYDARQQDQCRLYGRYLEIKAKNPMWGYKRIAKSMGQKIGKTRWWHANKHIPVPIQTAHWLKENGLLPLRENHPHLPLIAKILGATFGDGGIFENLNGIFLSSYEMESAVEFGHDLMEIFGKEANRNSRIIEGGEWGHSWCYQNTNRNIIRFFAALGAPLGNKTKIGLEIPNWIYLQETFADHFFGALLGGELGAPKVHKRKNRLQTLDFGITGPESLEENRMAFLNRVKKYLECKEVLVTSILKRKTRNETLALYRLMISIRFDNVVNFIKRVEMHYCRYKKEKMLNAINEFARIKRDKYQKLVSGGYGAEHAMKTLNLTPKSLYAILSEERVEA
ncbi:ATP-binding protein [Candidatus Woesearchaeota archaeon]|nr:ATP-binding protein [Candidatus Woesearchaeota archaeon]